MKTFIWLSGGVDAKLKQQLSGSFKIRSDWGECLLELSLGTCRAFQNQPDGVMALELDLPEFATLLDRCQPEFIQFERIDQARLVRDAA